MNVDLNDVGGRKFVLTVAIMIIFTIFVIVDKMTADQFIAAVLVNLGIFSGANVVQKFSNVDNTNVVI